jgi:hypothetical protein
MNTHTSRCTPQGCAKDCVLRGSKDEVIPLSPMPPEFGTRVCWEDGCNRPPTVGNRCEIHGPAKPCSIFRYCLAKKCKCRRLDGFPYCPGHMRMGQEFVQTLVDWNCIKLRPIQVEVPSYPPPPPPEDPPTEGNPITDLIEGFRSLSSDSDPK